MKHTAKPSYGDKRKLVLADIMALAILKKQPGKMEVDYPVGCDSCENRSFCPQECDYCEWRFDCPHSRALMDEVTP